MYNNLRISNPDHLEQQQQRSLRVYKTKTSARHDSNSYEHRIDEIVHARAGVKDTTVFPRIDAFRVPVSPAGYKKRP